MANTRGVFIFHNFKLQQYFEETSLLNYRDSLTKHVLSIKEACYYSRQILQSILFAHELVPPVVNNDLKCSNVLLYHDGERYSAVLTDYEYATTQGKRRGGTRFFMAPKALDESANPADDIFSFGVMFLEMTIPGAIPKTSVVGRAWPEFRAAKVQELKNKNMPVGLLIEACFRKYSKKRPTAEYLLERINEIGVEAKWWPETSTCTPSVPLELK